MSGNFLGALETTNAISNTEQSQSHLMDCGGWYNGSVVLDAAGQWDIVECLPPENQKTQNN
jgi:hypothetical protein